MNTQSNAASAPSLGSPAVASASRAQIRPLRWSVRRELWENRSLYIAPVAMAAVYLIAYMISLIWLPNSMRQVWMPHGMRDMEATLGHLVGPGDTIVEIAMPYSHAAMLLMLIAFIVGVIYSLDALHGERRDRTLLFWKSLPVSDLTTVLAKASIPLVFLPLLVFALTVTLQQIMRLLALVVLSVTGAGVATLWTRLPLFEMEVVTFYGAAVIALWHAPIYCWMLLVSGWARRATLLWAVLPPLALAAVENIAFHTSYLGSMLQNRLFGFSAAAFNLIDKNGAPIDSHFIPLAQLTPGRFLSSPSLWLGLAFAAACLAAAVRLRRSREPI
jgi:ABC-2 type transport system permease protein